MIKIILNDRDTLESTIKKLKKLLNNNGVINDFKKNLFYKKPSILKKEKKLKSIKRFQKKIRISYIKKNFY